MANASFLFDSYNLAAKVLEQDALNEAVCTAIRLGRNSLEQERQAAFLAPLLQRHVHLQGIDLDEDLEELLDVCVLRSAETPAAHLRRVVESSNLSAIRVLLAQLFQQEYGEGAGHGEAGAQRRKAIRQLCKAAPCEIWSDIVQGPLKCEDADFLARPDFTILSAQQD